MASTPAKWLTVALCCLSWVARSDTPEVNLPIEEYEALKAQLRVIHAPKEPKAGVAVVDRLRLVGSFARKDLSLTLEGRSLGKVELLPVLSGNIRLRDCSGNIRKTDWGYVISPVRPLISVRCRVVPYADDTLAFVTCPEVLWVETAIPDGSPIIQDESDGGRTINIAHAAGNVPLVPATSPLARYQLTVEPDATRFSYRVSVHNPNRVPVSFTVHFQSGEHVESIQAKGSFRTNGWPNSDTGNDACTFELPPGEGTITISGTLTWTSFLPPVAAGQQYLLLESHPLLRAEVKEGPKRISVPETGLAARYRGAEAYLLDTFDLLQWTVAKVETMTASGLSITQSDHLFYVDREARVVGESSIALENQGSADITIPMNATPSFASIQGVPVLLTTSPEGHLWLPLRPGAQTVGSQFTSALMNKPGIAWGKLWLPELDAPATNTRILLRYAKEWTPLVERFQTGLHLRLPSRVRALWAGVVAAGALASLLALGWSRRRSLLMAFIAGLAVLAANWSAWMIVGGEAAILAVWLTSRTRHYGNGAGVASALIGVLVAIIVIGQIPPPDVEMEKQAVRIVPPALAVMARAPDNGPGYAHVPLAPIDASVEQCNGLDNDCDGSYDNFAGSSTRLSTGSGWDCTGSAGCNQYGAVANGRCRAGDTTCQGAGAYIQPNSRPDFYPNGVATPPIRCADGSPSGFGDTCEELKDNYPRTPLPLSPTYAGLPARVTIPEGAQSSTFVTELVATQDARSVQVFLINSRLLTFLTTVLAILCVLTFLAQRQRLVADARALLARDSVATLPASALPVP